MQLFHRKQSSFVHGDKQNKLCLTNSPKKIDLLLYTEITLMGLKTCEIVFDTAVCVFKTGEWIHGRVIVEPDEDSKVKGQIHTKPLQFYCKNSAGRIESAWSLIPTIFWHFKTHAIKQIKDSVKPTTVRCPSFSIHRTFMVHYFAFCKKML